MYSYRRCTSFVGVENTVESFRKKLTTCDPLTTCDHLSRCAYSASNIYPEKLQPPDRAGGGGGGGGGARDYGPMRHAQNYKGCCAA